MAQTLRIGPSSRADLPSNGALVRAFVHIRQSRPIQILLAISLAVVVTGGALAAAMVSNGREQAIRDNLREISSLSTVLTEEAARSFQGVHLLVNDISETLTQVGYRTIEDFREQLATKEMWGSLKAKSTGLPQLGSITIVDKAGDLVAFTWSHPAPKINVADRDYFKHFQSNPNDDGAYLSRPVQNKVTGSWTLLVVRPIRGADKTVMGLVLGTIDLRYFRNLYRDLNLIEGSSVAMWRVDGHLLIREPDIERVGSFVQSTLLKRLKESPTGVAYENARSLDPRDQDTRLIAARYVRDYPVAIAVSRSSTTALAEWRSQAAIATTAACLIAFAMLIGVGLLARQFAFYEQVNRLTEQQHKAVLEREQLERALRQTQKLETIGQLTAGIAHDFNNLLTVIAGNLELLDVRMAKQQVPAAIRKNLDSAREASTRAAGLTNRLLAFSRKQPLAPVTLRVNTLVAGMLELTRRSLGEDVVVKTSFARNLWPVYVDRNQLESALLNLVVNSRDAMPEGGTLTIAAANVESEALGLDVQDALGGELVSISVTDTGSGMDPETREKAFEPFFTTKDVGKGSGLGLSQLYGFVRQSGGDVTIVSSPGSGTTVTIYLPRSRRLEPGETAPADMVVRGNGEVILLVDDNEEVRTYGYEALKELGYKVLEAGSADEAIELLRNNHVDLLLTDIGLPGDDGAALVIRAREIQPDLKAVFATGYSKGENFAPENLDDPVLMKPFTYTSASGTIREILDREPRAA